MFVDACNGVAELDAQFQHLRVLVTGTTSLTNELRRAIQTPVTRPLADLSDGLLAASRELSNTTHLRIAKALEELDVAIAERDFPLAKKLLLESDKEMENVCLFVWMNVHLLMDRVMDALGDGDGEFAVSGVFGG